MELSPEKKIAGILAPLFGLRSENDLGVGDVAVLREFIDWAAEIGFKLVQLLPINEMGQDNSPYNAISAIAIEPTTLHLAPGSLEDLTRDDYESELADVDLTKLLHARIARSIRLRQRPVRLGPTAQQAISVSKFLRARIGVARRLRVLSRA